MEKDKKKEFKWRGLVTFLMAMGMFVEIISGVVLYITPLGRFANWNNWTLWGLSKGEWGAVHTIFGYLLLIIMGIHLYFNWRVISHFLWNKVRSSFNLKREFAVSTILTVLVFAGTLLYVPPFSTIMAFGETAKLSWEKNSGVASTRGYGRRALLSQGTDNVMSRGEQERDHVSSFENNGSSSPQYKNEEFASRRQGNERWASTSSQYGNAGFNSQRRGNGCLARNQSVPQNYSAPYSNRNQNSAATSATLRGRDFARLGTRTSLSGTLVRIGDEWGLKAGDTVYEVHMEPSEYMASQGVVLKDGALAKVKGFVYEANISVATMETGGGSILLRDEAGRPAWAGSRFSQGGVSGNWGNK